MKKRIFIILIILILSLIGCIKEDKSLQEEIENRSIFIEFKAWLFGQQDYAITIFNNQSFIA